tara:strand:- start:1090 stop:1482 length:393 start_codon:yes stop_codon:yes gene_type:complete
MMLENINTFLSGIIVGMIIFQSSVIAPTIFSTLDEKNAGKIIRNIFPKLFKIIAFMGFYMTIASILINSDLINQVAYVITFLLMTINFLIIPATNKSRDEGNNKKFRFLHSISVLTTMLILFFHSYLIIF